MHTVLTLINHLLPVLITLCLAGGYFLINMGYPYLKHITLVAAANTPEGVATLAKYLAHKTGGKRIHVSQTWESFITPGEDLHKLHVERVKNLQN